MMSSMLLPFALAAAMANPAGETPADNGTPFPHIIQTSASDRWYDDEYKTCDGSTVDMVECIGALRDKWDKRLNAAYGKVMKGLSGEQKTALRDAQRKWIAYRDADCSFYAGGEGTISRIEAATCLFALTRDRAQELEMMLEP